MCGAIEVMANAFSELSNGTVEMPVRMVSHFDGTTFFCKPAASPIENTIGVKILTQVSANRERALPVIQGVMLLTDYRDGRFLALIDGTSLTALRTGAAAGLATQLLANEEAQTAAIFGAGAQGRTQLAAICAVRHLKKVYIFDICAQAVEAFMVEMQAECAAELVPAKGLNVLKEADVICTATNAMKPLFGWSYLKKGVHINAIGSFKPDMQEISEEVVAKARLYVDHKASALSEAGDLIKPLQLGLIDESHIIGEIGALVNGKIAGRRSKDEITLFKSVGVAAQDLAVASTVYWKAVSDGLGREIEI
jgi:ornithine cyclodeaminase/alanine dehydrogenase